MVLVLFMIGMLFVSFLGTWLDLYFMMMVLVLFWVFNGFSSHDIIIMHYMFSYDVVSWSLVILSLWIGSLMLLASLSSVVGWSRRGFPYVVVILSTFLSLTFMVNDYMLFYVFFEASLIPIFILVMGWGYQPERLQAGYYLLFYTLFGSLPLLLVLMYLMSESGSLSFHVVNLQFSSVILFLGAVLGFLIKMPMFLMHLWLPKAHVEASISGSMMLAGVLLKLGGYGLIRILGMFKPVLSRWSCYIISLALFSLSIMSLLCLRQYDLKSLIAYSSVAHMSMVLGGLMAFNSWGVKGSLVMMLGHGLCSSGLFCLANIVYERMKSRCLLVCRGLLLLLPNLCLWWFLLTISNMSAPPSLNLLGEIGLLVSILSWSSCSMLLLFLGSFLSGCYSIYMYSITQHGRGLWLNPLYGCSNREYVLLLSHWLPLNVVVLSFDVLFYYGSGLP